MPLLKRIARASVLTVVLTALFQLLNLLVTVAVGRTGGPEGLGLYTALMMFLNMFSLVAIFGIPTALSKLTAEHAERGEAPRIPGLLSSVLLFALVASLLVSLLAGVSVPSLARLMQVDAGGALSTALMWILPLFIVAQIARAVYQGNLQPVKAALIQIAAPLGTLLCLGAALFSAFFDIYRAVTLGFLASALGALLLCGRDGLLSRRVSREQLLPVLSFALPLALMSYFTFAAYWVDRIILGMFLGVEEIGIYSAAVNVVRATRFVPVALTPILVPAYTMVAVRGRETSERTLNLHVKLSALLLFYTGSLTFFYAEDLVALLYADPFADAATVLKWLSAGTFVSAYTLPMASLITASGYPRYNLYMSLIAVPLQVVLTVWLTQIYGVLGPAVVNALQSLVYLVGGIWVVRRVLRLRLRRETLDGPLLAVVALGTVLYGSAWLVAHHWLWALVATAVFAAVGWCFALSDTEHADVRELWRGAV